MSGGELMAAQGGLPTPIRVGVVGCGNIVVGYHLPAFRALADLVRVVAIADPSPERRAAATRLTGLPPEDVLDDPYRLVERDDVDVVELATPPHVRVPIALRAIEAGKPVLCEKPVATVPSDAARLVRAAAECHVPVGVVHNYLSFPEVVGARELIDAGEIGVPEVVIANYLGVEDRPGVAGYRPGWRHDPAIAGGGVLMDILHAMYVAEAFLGAPARRISAYVSARTPDAPVEDLALCRLETDDRGVALVNVGWGVGPGDATVSGDRGRIEIRYRGGGKPPFAPLEEVAVVHADGARRVVLGPIARAPGAPLIDLVPTFRDFFGRVASGQPLGVSAEDGLHVLEACLAAYESAALGRTISLPLREDDPVHLRGIGGLRELKLDPEGRPATRGLFGLGAAPLEA